MILLSFDIEEFDMPLEYQGEISFEEQISISQAGLTSILDLLEKYSVPATFFSTVVFAQNSHSLIRRLLDENHELASHTWYHSHFEIEDLAKSRIFLEQEFHTKVCGLRMPRMAAVDSDEVEKAGYIYNSSINPTFLPGRYNHLNVSRTYFYQNNLIQIPASVSYLRFPLFWLSFHHLPLDIYQFLMKRSYKDGKYVNIYFHPWEFSEIKNPQFNLPKFTTKNTGKEMVDKFDRFLYWLTSEGYSFVTFQQFISKLNT